MFRQTHFGFDWGELITGVALLIAAVVMLRHPGATLLTLTFIFAIIAIIRGISTLAAFPKLKEFTGKLSWISLIAGIFDLLIGVMFMFNLRAGALSMTYLFAIWFLVDSISNLFNSGHLRRAGMGWFLLDVILDLFSIFVGILLFMQPVVSAVSLTMLLAIFFIIFGINAIITAFARQQI